MASAFGHSREKKSEDMRKQLGIGEPRGLPTPGLLSDKTHLLIVNGGGHEAFLGDFFGLVRFFEKRIKPDFGGEFWTCENPIDYFNLRNHTDIKFGGDTVLAKYEVVLKKFEGGRDNWEYIAPADLLTHVASWLKIKTDSSHENRVKDGDSVIIIFLAHGHASTATMLGDGVKLGDEVLYVDTFVDMLRKFPRTVQVNVISNSCYSGIFAEKFRTDSQQNRWVQAASGSTFQDKAWPAAKSPSNRFRNGLFVAGLVRSLGGLTTGKDSPSLRMVKDQLEKATQSAPDPRQRSTPTAYHTASVENGVAELLFRQFADFPLLPNNVAARRRAELNQTYLSRYATPSEPSAQAVSFALNIIDEECRAFGMDNQPDYNEGMFVVAAMHHPEQHMADILRALMWRGRHQSNVFQTFMLLCLHGYCDLSALSRPVDYDEFQSDDRWLQSSLLAFTSFRELSEQGRKVAHLESGMVDWQHFLYPLLWLRIMLRRSAVDIVGALNFLALTTFLGEIDLDCFSKIPVMEKPWVPDRDTNWDLHGKRPPCFGLMLPGGIELCNPINSFESVQKTFYSRFDKVEQAYEEFFGVPGEQGFSLKYQQDKDEDVRDWQMSFALTPHDAR